MALGCQLEIQSVTVDIAVIRQVDRKKYGRHRAERGGRRFQRGLGLLEFFRKFDPGKKAQLPTLIAAGEYQSRSRYLNIGVQSKNQPMALTRFRDQFCSALKQLFTARQRELHNELSRPRTPLRHP